MKKRKQASSDFTFAQLPHNRKEVFFDCLKLRFGTVVCCGLLLLLFLLPLIAIEITYDIVNLNIYNSLIGGQMSEMQATLYKNELQLYVSLAQIVCLGIFAVGLAGVARILRQLVWGEPIFFWVDFKRGIKQNAARFIAVFVICALVNVAAVLCSTMLDEMPIVGYIPLGVLIFVAAPVALFVLSQSIIYSVGFSKAITNGLAFYGKRPGQTLLFTMFLVLVGLTRLAPVSALKYTLLLLGTVFLLPMYIMAWMLVSCNVFDEVVNRDNYPELYDKGVYRLDKQ